MSSLTAAAKSRHEGTPRRRLTLFRTSSFLVLMTAMAAPVVWTQESSFVDTVRRSGFIFIGTVKTLGAATPTVAGEPNSAVVTVNRVLEALPPVGNPAGQDVTVRLRDPQKFHAGDRAVFFTYVQSAGKTLGLVEVAS